MKVLPTTAASGTTRYLVDFGRELQGGLNVTFQDGVAGARVAVGLSEELLEDGGLKVPMRTGNNFTDVWTLSDGAQSVSQHEYMVRGARSTCSPSTHRRG